MHQDFEYQDEFVGSLLPVGGVMGSYVLVAEVVMDDKTTLQVVSSRGTSPWSTIGMLVAAEGIVQESTSVTPHEEEDF